MPTVTGNARMFNGLPFDTARRFKLVFTPSGPAVSLSGGSFWGPPVEVAPSTVDGTFAVTLAATVGMIPETWYRLSATWLNSSEAPVGTDFPGWKVRVPSGGGDLRDLLEVPAEAGLIWIAESPPNDHKVFTGWVNSDPAARTPSGEMPYYEWE